MNQNQMDDHWLRPRTKAGTEEMRKRLKVMRSMLKEAATQSMEGRIASKVFDEYFSFDWEKTWDVSLEDGEFIEDQQKKVDLEKKRVALPDRCQYTGFSLRGMFVSYTFMCLGKVVWQGGLKRLGQEYNAS